MLLFQALGLVAMTVQGLTLWGGYSVRPRLRNLERRGSLVGSERDLLDVPINGLRMRNLIWRAAIPDDRPSLKRVIWMLRIGQILAPVLMIGAMAALGLSNGDGGQTSQPYQGPAPIRIDIEVT